jgi:hypothetical protein
MHTLASGSDYMYTQYTLSTATAPLPDDLRFFQYLDEDVYSVSLNILVQSGSIAGGDLELLTVHPDVRAGVAQAADGLATGWIADEYSDLRTLLNGGGVDAAAAGTVDTVDLVPGVDGYYGPMWGPADITTAIEWEIPAGVSSYTFIAGLGGLPEAPPPPPPDGDYIPEPMTLALFGSAIVGLVIRRRRKK